MNIGCYSGWIGTEFQQPEFLRQLEQLKNALNHSPAVVLSDGPDRVIKLPLILQNQTVYLAVKRFKRQSFLKDFSDRFNKTKAERSYLAAEFLYQHKIGTPKPVGYLDYWHNNRLLESYYLCLYQNSANFRDELSHLYWKDPDNAKLMALIETVAPAVRAMHDAGFMHGDMGNQNILLFKKPDGLWELPQFIDLNRAKISQPLSWKQRGFDLSRLTLPGVYLKIFKYIYSQGEEIPGILDKWEQRYRNRFARHSRSRKWRHPIRSFKNRNKVDPHPVYPKPQDIWIWDEKSAQAMMMLDRREKKQCRKKSEVLSLLWQSLLAAPAIYRNYKHYIKQSFSQPVVMKNRIGVALHPKSDYIEQELSLLEELGNPPVLVRFCHHETPHDWELGIELINRLYHKNIPVMAAFLQDRKAILQPESWRHFLETIIPHIADKVEQMEIAHAINRVKWGIWNAKEYRALLLPALDLQKRYPSIQLTGPAGIDFEYPYVIAALNAIPKNENLSALSHHLYVDRRGAPENKQGAFSTLEKAALLKAIAKCSRNCGEKVIVSEVNWPIKRTGIWSPIGSPYEAPSWHRDQPGVTEQEYSDYMLRYLVISLCSGHIDQVYWWRLSAHGFGLVDDLNNWRKRPAFTALGFFLKTLGNAQFIRKLPSPDHIFLLEFQMLGSRVVMAWTLSNSSKFVPDLAYDQAYDNQGQVLDCIELSESPIYLIKNI
ncbi:MAG: hypothetical protein K0R66_601 [Gammaproteobacteria bacterium]|jgi:hypothetical protein|nr:hypothetical protein [Gammaproteobacteria bacterium]